MSAGDTAMSAGDTAMSRAPSPALRLREAGYTYPSAATPAVSGVNLDVSPGELVLLTGPTGCGKSTLLRLAAGLLGRHGRGRVWGEVRVDGVDPAALPPSKRVRSLGFVSQEPGDQLVTGSVGDELAFGMESAGFDAAAIEAALPGLLERVGLSLSLDRDVRALSGGQTQRLVVAAALSAGARLLLLDEPLAQLDPEGAAALVSRLRALADEGWAVLVVEHRLEACWEAADRVAVNHRGRLMCDTSRAALTPGHPLLAELRALGLSLPGRLDLADRLHPRALEEARFSGLTAGPPLLRDAVLIELVELSHRYDGAANEALSGVDLRVFKGERIALLGPNGAGKSTLLRLLSGELGDTSIPLRVLAVPQDPDLALFCPSAREELAYGPREQRLSGEEVERRVEEAAAALSVSELLDRPPQALSRGQRLRVAVAAALSCGPELLLLDEPTSGQDREQVERMMAALGAAMAEGALVFATHDLDLALRHATRVMRLEGGRVSWNLPPAEALAAMAAETLPELAALCAARGLPLSAAAELAGAALAESAERPEEAP